MEAFRTLRPCARFLGGSLVSLTLVALTLASNTQVAEALSSCDATIYAADLGGALYAFTPPSAASAPVPGAPGNFFTISRGPYTGNVYTVSSGVPATLTSYNVTTN